jgi:hypothetical protein
MYSNDISIDIYMYICILLFNTCNLTKVKYVSRKGFSLSLYAFSLVYLYKINWWSAYKIHSLSLYAFSLVYLYKINWWSAYKIHSLSLSPYIAFNSTN